MQNIQVEEKGNSIIITIDKTKRLGRSASGKTVIVASTQGNQRLACGVTIGVNAYVKE